MGTAVEVGDLLTYEGSNFFRQHLILSCLSGKPVRIINIHHREEEPGLKDYEISFIRLLDCLSNGTRIEVNEAGTTVTFCPGVLVGGRTEHTCPNSRSIGYYLEPLFMLGPFCKKKLECTLKGITNNELDPSFDMLRYSLLPVLKKFLVVDEGLELKILRRSLPPNGNGQVFFSCPVRRSLNPFQWYESGKVKKIRGVAYTSRVTPTVANRMIEAAKKEFLKFLTDVYLTVDNSKGSSPGFGLCAVGETNKGTFYSAESMNCKLDKETTDRDAMLPEDVGQEAAWRLWEEVHRGGCVDALSQPLVLLFMVLSSRDVSKIVLGPLTPYSMHLLRHMRDVFHVTFKIEEYRQKKLIEDDDSENEERKTGANKLLLTCVGIGFSNISKGQI